MGPRLAALIVVAGCGRVAFDSLGAPGDATGDGGAPGDAGLDAGQVPPPGAKIWLKMETDPTMSIVDSAGGHAANCVLGICPMRAAAVHGTGYSFSTQEIDVANAGDLDASSGFTGAIWIELAGVPASTACVWTKSFDGANGYDTFTLCVDTSAQPVFDCETPAGAADSETVPVPLSLGQWHHLAFTWDGTTKRGFVDGIEQVAVPLQIGTGGTDPVALGGSRGGYYLDGELDDALYYTRALSSPEIAQLATP
ncbi:MAG: LamG domain-containing protein [Acidobacteriota bacterium]